MCYLVAADSSVSTDMDEHDLAIEAVGDPGEALDKVEVRDLLFVPAGPLTRAPYGVQLAAWHEYKASAQAKEGPAMAKAPSAVADHPRPGLADRHSHMTTCIESVRTSSPTLGSGCCSIARIVAYWSVWRHVTPADDR